MKKVICLLFSMLILILGCKPKGDTINQFLYKHQEYWIHINGVRYDANNLFKLKQEHREELVLRVADSEGYLVDEVFLNGDTGEWVKFDKLPYSVQLYCG